MQITYNFLNLPSVIKRGTAVKALYSYYADGSKSRVIDASGTGYDYMGSFKYARKGNTLTLESAAASGGRIHKTATGYEVRYHVTDHLGSVRLVTSANGTILEQNDYHPYGTRHANAGHATTPNPYLYGGKELQQDFGVNYYDSHARFQTNSGIFLSIDPLSEQMPGVSPYAYCSGNPINRVDIKGLRDDEYFDINGNYLGSDDASTDYVQIMAEKDWKEHATDGTIDHQVGSQLSTNVTEMEMSEKAVKKIVGHYNDKLNETDGKVDVKIGLTVAKPSVAMQYDPGISFSFGGLLDITLKSPSIRTNYVRKTVHENLNTVSNITNSLVHERDHSINSESGRAKRELHAIKMQKSHPSYSKTTEKFKLGVDNYEKEWINEQR